jgi:FixJ family two-component response regulator
MMSDCAGDLYDESAQLAETTCVITDLQMPGLSGLELQEELRSRDTGRLLL